MWFKQEGGDGVLTLMLFRRRDAQDATTFGGVVEAHLAGLDQEGC